MDYAMLMRMQQPPRDLSQNPDLLRKRKPRASFDHFPQAAPLDQLHHEVRRRIVLTKIVDLMMFLCFRIPVVAGSERNRASMPGSLTEVRTLIATSRRMTGSQARYKAPKPPFPISPRTRYLPICSISDWGSLYVTRSAPTRS